jgi:hypothetical protein
MSKPRPVRPASAARAADRPRPAGARGQADACPAAERSLRPERSSLPKSVPCCRRRRERERLEGLLKGLLSSRRSRKRQQQQRQQQRKGRKGHEAQAHPKRFVAIWQQEGSAITHTGQSVIIKRGASNKNHQACQRERFQFTVCEVCGNNANANEAHQTPKTCLPLPLH